METKQIPTVSPHPLGSVRQDESKGEGKVKDKGRKISYILHEETRVRRTDEW